MHISRFTRVTLVWLALALLCAVAPAARADGPIQPIHVLHADADSTRSSMPQDFQIIGDTLYFTAYAPSYGNVLWRSDGTAAGTRMVREVAAQHLIALGGELYFIGNDRSSGYELWRSDGTPEGTRLVKDINPRGDALAHWYFRGGLFTSPPVRAGAALFFLADDGSGYRLWRSDGSAAGTVLVSDQVMSAIPMALDAAELNGVLFFTFPSGGELWRSDGTSQGTTLVKTLKRDTTYTNLRELTTVGRQLFFSRKTDTDYELWQSDGTADGTTLVKTFELAQITGLTSAGGRLFFSASDGSHGQELWTSDGTAKGTRQLPDIAAGAADANPQNLTLLNDTLFFSAVDASRALGLWQHRLSTDHSELVRQIAPAGNATNGLAALTAQHGTLFFLSRTYTTTTALWRSDGTTDGTVPLRSFRPESDWKSASSPPVLAVLGDRLLLAAPDPASGTELWRSDGTVEGTLLLKDINQGEVTPAQTILTTTSHSLFMFSQDQQRAHHLWHSDGTPHGTTLIKDIDHGFAGAQAVVVSDTLLFVNTTPEAGTELWKSDGTPHGTTLLKDINSGADGSYPSNLTVVNGRLFFSASTPDMGTELWASDGTPEGTQLVKDIEPGPNASTPTYLTNRNGTLFFLANTTGPGSEVWKSDGTAAGTVPVAAQDQPAISNAQVMRAVGDALFIIGYDEDEYLLWKSDGTPTGALLLAHFPTYPWLQPEMIDVQGTLFFTISTRDGYFLWKSDGTVEGTRQIKHILSGEVIVCGLTCSISIAPPTNLTAIGRTLFFTASDGALGDELWVSDGTEAGTHVVKDIIPGPTGARPSRLTAIDGMLLFSASDDTHGQELWQSDGTEAGTQRVTDLAPGSASANPSRAIALGNQVFFVAGDGGSTQTLSALPRGLAPALDAPALSGARPGGAALLPIRLRNTSLAAAEHLTLTLTLADGLTLLDDTLLHTASVSGSTYTWSRDGTAANHDDLVLRLGVPSAAIGTRYPITLTLTLTRAGLPPATISTTAEVMVAHQALLSIAQR